jgi:hypothetical protein
MSYPKFDDLNDSGRIRKLNVELYFLKNELEQHRAIISALLDGLARIGEETPGRTTDLGAELRSLRFDFDQNSRNPDPDFYRKPT